MPRKGTVLMLLGLLLIAAALSLCAYNLVQEHQAEQESAQVLASLDVLMRSEATATPQPVQVMDDSGLPAVATRVPQNMIPSEVSEREILEQHERDSQQTNTKTPMPADETQLALLQPEQTTADAKASDDPPVEQKEPTAAPVLPVITDQPINQPEQDPIAATTEPEPTETAQPVSTAVPEPAKTAQIATAEPVVEVTPVETTAPQANVTETPVIVSATDIPVTTTMAAVQQTELVTATPAPEQSVRMETSSATPAPKVQLSDKDKQHALAGALEIRKKADDQGIDVQAAAEATPAPTAKIPDYILYPEMEMPEVIVDGEAYIGMIQIPVLKLLLPVMSEWSYPRLKIAPCRFTGTAYTGQFFIMAHNYNTHFGMLKTLQLGDTVIFTDVEGRTFYYRVAQMETIPGDKLSRMMDTQYPLTLFTCTIGGAMRVTIRCERVEMEE